MSLVHSLSLNVIRLFKRETLPYRNRLVNPLPADFTAQDFRFFTARKAARDAKIKTDS